jgi:hypothetical protein
MSRIFELSPSHAPGTNNKNGHRSSSHTNIIVAQQRCEGPHFDGFQSSLRLCNTCAACHTSRNSPMASSLTAHISARGRASGDGFEISINEASSKVRNMLLLLLLTTEFDARSPDHLLLPTRPETCMVLRVWTCIAITYLQITFDI